VPSSGAGSVSNPCSPSSGFPFTKGCAALSLSTAVAELSGFLDGVGEFPKSGPHPMTGVPSKAWSSPIAGTGVAEPTRIIPAQVRESTPEGSNVLQTV
jgi:hypothetical protein